MARLVVLVMAINALGYIAVRSLGPTYGATQQFKGKAALEKTVSFGLRCPSNRAIASVSPFRRIEQAVFARTAPISIILSIGEAQIIREARHDRYGL